MSLPKFPKKETIFTRDEAIDSILTSIAMEEIALSHILNAEGEKIQCAIANLNTDRRCYDLQTLLEVNHSASSILQQVTDLQIILKNKLKIITDIIPKEQSELKPCPSYPKKCVAEFLATKYRWQSGLTLPFENATHCKTNITLTKKDCGYYIVLPHSGKYKINLELELKVSEHGPVVIEIVLQDTCMNTIYSKQIIESEHKLYTYLSDCSIWEVPESKKEHFLSVKLLSKNNVDIIRGKISIVEKF